MKPNYQIIANGSDITPLLADRLISLTVTDEAGITSDQVEISLDDRDHQFSIPDPAAVLVVSMGYGRDLKPMGQYTVDEVEVSAMPAQMKIRGKSADMGSAFKSHKKRSWDKTTIGEIIACIAADHDLKAAVDPDFEQVSIDHLDQTYESDLNILTRLADEHNAIFKPAGGKLLFVKRGQGTDANGDPLSSVILKGRNDIIQSWRSSYQERSGYACVGAHFNDKGAGQVEHVFAGDGEPIFYIKKPFKDKETALEGAKAFLAKQSLGKRSLSLTCVGNATLSAEMPIDLVNVRRGVDGRWICTKVTHSFSTSGYTTTLEACRPEDFEKKD